MNNRYLVGPATNVIEGACLGSRKVTIHDTHESAVNECHRRLGGSGNFQTYVIYRAISQVRRIHQPVEVCDILDDGEVSCPE